MIRFVMLTFLVISAAQAAVIGQIDDFQDGTTQGWFKPPGASIPLFVLPNGQGGAGDFFLFLASLGGLDDDALLVSNDAQWTGDYTTSGIGSIEMDVRNLGPQDVSLRLLFEELSGSTPVNQAISANAIVVPAGGQWTRIAFPILPAALVAGTGTVDGALSNTTVLRLFHNPDPTYPSEGLPPVFAFMGVDNIEAVAAPNAIPEPATLLLAGMGLILASAIRRNKRA